MANDNTIRTRFANLLVALVFLFTTGFTTLGIDMDSILTIPMQHYPL